MTDTASFSAKSDDIIDKKYSMHTCGHLLGYVVQSKTTKIVGITFEYLLSEVHKKNGDKESRMTF